MSRFVGELRTRTLSAEECRVEGSGVALFELLADFSFESEQFGQLTVPAGFKTDYASIPRGAWLWMSPDDPAIAFASVIHDWLYSRKGILPGFRPALNREQADGVLGEAMALCGARKDQIAVVCHTVRLFGGSHWHA